MKPVLVLVSLGTLTLATATARADQCQWLDHATAARALGALASQPEVVAFCEPCGDIAPGIPYRATATSLRPAGEAVELVVNGAAVDLAYVYAKTDARTFHNLAALADCPARGVSPTLAIADETADGVLITASDRPAPVSAPAPVVLVVPAPRGSLPWWLLAGTGLGGASLGALAALAAVARRRRLPMRPRALELPAR